MGTVTNIHSTAGHISWVTFVQATVLWWCNQNMPFTPSAASHTYNIGLPSHNCRVLPGLAIEPKRRVFAWAVIETLPYLWLKSDYCSYKVCFYYLLWILWTWMFFTLTFPDKLQLETKESLQHRTLVEVRMSINALEGEVDTYFWNPRHMFNLVRQVCCLAFA